MSGVVARVGDFIVSLTNTSADDGPQGSDQQAVLETVTDRLRAAGLVR